MYLSQLKTGILVRNHILSVLLRLNRFRPIHSLNLRIYSIITRLITLIVKRLPGVEFIYLRRGMAKNEVMPYLSDIDMTVIVKNDGRKEKTVVALQNLQRIVPVLEPQSQVLSVDEFLSLFDMRKLSTNKSFLYRILEGKLTWKMLYSRSSYNIFDKLEIPEERVIRVLILSEMLYWHGIVISEHTAYHLSKQDRLSTFLAGRFCWSFMKSTTELTNLFYAFSDPGSLAFYRKTVIRSAVRELKNSRWIDLFRKNERILKNEFNPVHVKPYLEEAFAYLSCLYRSFFNVMESTLKHERELVGWWRRNCHGSSEGKPPKLHSIDLDKAARNIRLREEQLSAVFLTPQPVYGSKTKLLVVIVLDRLDAVPRENILLFITSLQRELRSQGVKSSEIRINLADHFGFLCFSAPLQFGLYTKCVFKKEALYMPSLYEMLFDDSLEHHECGHQPL